MIGGHYAQPCLECSGSRGPLRPTPICTRSVRTSWASSAKTILYVSLCRRSSAEMFKGLSKHSLVFIESSDAQRTPGREGSNSAECRTPSHTSGPRQSRAPTPNGNQEGTEVPCNRRNDATTNARANERKPNNRPTRAKSKPHSK